MVGKIARGAYVFVVATMFVAWIISFNKEASAKPQTRPAGVVHPFVVSCRRRRASAHGRMHMNSALAQVVIPYGNFDDGFEKYLVAAITFLLLCFAVWQYFRDRK